MQYQLMLAMNFSKTKKDRHENVMFCRHMQNANNEQTFVSKLICAE